ncbi:hypothetical protein KN10_0861 [Anoxybacillus flavithermus NBRC 109594]|uniref:Uncharacterized protein n=1 Tax=Anoxybacillus flavithermus NBRC 109594 TaxID=1315967 RepID=R4FC94_9BACL|nr:hypothetical protein KN10_0861 [Anoxybacillus flavithermus NBRC 109594]
MAERGLHKLIFIPFSLYLLTIFFTFGRSFFSRFLCTRSLPFSSLLHIYEPQHKKFREQFIFSCIYYEQTYVTRSES